MHSRREDLRRVEAFWERNCKKLDRQAERHELWFKGSRRHSRREEAFWKGNCTKLHTQTETHES